MSLYSSYVHMNIICVVSVLELSRLRRKSSKYEIYGHIVLSCMFRTVSIIDQL